MTDRMEATVKVGVIAGIGDRRPEDNREIGAAAARMFDEIIIRQDKHLRGRTEHELIGFLQEGIASVDPAKPVKVIPSEAEAIAYAIEHAKKGALIVLSSDVVPDALEQVMRFKEEEVDRLRETGTADVPQPA
jgi:cyanophycin synthetase